MNSGTTLASNGLNVSNLQVNDTFGVDFTGSSNVLVNEVETIGTITLGMSGGNNTISQLTGNNVFIGPITSTKTLVSDVLGSSIIVTSLVNTNVKGLMADTNVTFSNFTGGTFSDITAVTGNITINISVSGGTFSNLSAGTTITGNSQGASFGPPFDGVLYNNLEAGTNIDFTLGNNNKIYGASSPSQIFPGTNFLV
jgi:hypothetical protein